MSENDSDIQRILLRYRPVDPPGRLRGRILAEAVPAPIAHRWPTFTIRLAAAAMFLLGIGLHRVSNGMTATLAAQVGIGPVVWNQQAEAAAELLQAGASGRRYIALGLMASGGRGAPPDMPTVGALP